MKTVIKYAPFAIFGMAAASGYDAWNWGILIWIITFTIWMAIRDNWGDK